MSPHPLDLTPSALRRLIEGGEPLVLVDVREPTERARCALPHPSAGLDLHVPMSQVPSRLGEIRDAARVGPVVVYCHHGVRSLLAGRWLAAQGVPRVHNLDGGIDAYSLEADPSVPRY